MFFFFLYPLSFIFCQVLASGLVFVSLWILQTDWKSPTKLSHFHVSADIQQHACEYQPKLLINIQLFTSIRGLPSLSLLSVFRLIKRVSTFTVTVKSIINLVLLSLFLTGSIYITDVATNQASATPIVIGNNHRTTAYGYLGQWNTRLRFIFKIRWMLCKYHSDFAQLQYIVI